MVYFPRGQRIVLRDALVTLLADQRRKFMSGGELCVETVLRALLELREASLEVIDAITRYNVHAIFGVSSPAYFRNTLY